MTPPLWLAEGFANYVGYSGSGLPPGVIAADLVPLLRAGRAEQHLPTASAFDPTLGPIAPAYADAWLAVTLIADGSATRAVQFYRTACAALAPPAPAPAAGATPGSDPSGSNALSTAFAAVIHEDQAGFETRWRSWRQQLLLPSAGSARS